MDELMFSSDKYATAGNLFDSRSNYTSFKIKKKNPITISFEIEEDRLSSFYQKIKDIELLTQREPFYLKAIKNLRKKSNFLQLTIQLLEEQISEDEFASEIEENQDDYVVEIEAIKSFKDLQIISEIIHKLNDKRIQTDEVAEMFSLELSELVEKALQEE